jgi:YfiR/HmsC-like
LDKSFPVPQKFGKRPSGKLRGVFSRWPVICMLALLAFSSALAPSASLHAQSKATSEYEIKAAYLYNFAKFVEWSPSGFSDPKQPLSICVFGRDPFGHALEDALLGKTIGDHPVAIGRAKQLADLTGCKIVFVSAAESPRISEILARFRSNGALLVGESEGFAAAGGAIQFVLDQNRVRFAINPDAADRAGLKISSKLLALASIVHDADRVPAARN